MSDDGYQGWTNYATWCVHLWLSNEEPSYRLCVELAQECRDAAPTESQVLSGIWTTQEAATYLLADRLRFMHQNASIFARIRTRDDAAIEGRSAGYVDGTTCSDAPQAATPGVFLVTDQLVLLF